jgi:hypothetical protein
MFSCPICSEWVLVAKLCGECDKIRQLCKLYGKEKLLQVLDKTMVIQKLKKEEENIDEH